MYKIFFKPFLDFIIAFFILIILAPILVIVTIFLFFANRGKPFFLQRRPGLNGKLFRIIKFKTMNDKVNIMGQLLPDNERLTIIGKFVRTTSIDEVPQMLNVLFGQMSLVGPRPLLVDYIPLYNDFQMKRHNVKPGVTGYAQVNGRNSVTWKQRFEMDVWYVENVSFFLDIKILIGTAVKVFYKEGISPQDSHFMERFQGNN